MTLQIFDTLTGEKRAFEPLDPGRVRIYVCGPTVYDMAHMGHARAYVAFDVVVRYLRRSYEVTYARNYTDVDDKIIQRAAQSGEDPAALAGRFTREFLTDMDALGVARPDLEPRVTDHVGEIIALVEELVARGHAYAADGDVYYAVRSFEPYGALSRRSLDDMRAGARVEPGERKRDPLDFALWKGAKPGEPSWESPWGPGRPGWHIECSAMSMRHLGASFDIHGGGKDLVFPHHENEIAQSEAATGAPYARWWMHNGFVNVDGEKMSKSLGNFFTVRDVLVAHDPEALRFFLLSSHYRSPINYGEADIAQAESRVRYCYETLARLDQALAAADAPAPALPYRDDAVATLVERFEAAMDDDFNTARALGELSDAFRLVNEIIDRPADADTDRRTLAAIRAALVDAGGVLGLFTARPDDVLARMRERRASGVDTAAIERLVSERAEARASRDFARADRIRDELTALGVVLKDGPGGTTWEGCLTAGTAVPSTGGSDMALGYWHVLLPLDFAPHNARAIEAVAALDLPAGATISLLHVIEPLEGLEDDEVRGFHERLEESAVTRLETARGQLATCAAQVETSVRFGHRVRTILDFAAERGIDLIVLTARPADPEGPRSWATIGHGVTLMAPCSVLVVRG